MSAEPSSHRIRLRGPWEFAWLEEGAEEAPALETVTMPVSWQELFGSRAGRALFRRRFNRPSNLEAGQRVRIVIADAAGAIVLRLNGEPVSVMPGQDGKASAEVADLLQDFNSLEIELCCDPGGESSPPAGLWRPVVLEIEEFPGHDESSH